MVLNKNLKQAESYDMQFNKTQWSNKIHEGNLEAIYTEQIIWVILIVMFIFVQPLIKFTINCFELYIFL